MKKLWAGLAAVVLVGCASPTTALAPTFTAITHSVPSMTPSPAMETPTRSPSPAPSATAEPTATPTPAMQICSPLEGIALEELSSPDLLKNPFDPPLPGLDSGHHGADFAYWSRGERDSMLGLPVRAALAGRVAGVIYDRPPYGNAVIIETALDGLPPDWFESAIFPTPGPTGAPDASLFCPAGANFGVTGPGQSLYLLYAHMQEAPPVQIGQAVTCGQVIGKVGTTGKSVNPHLHLETRVGPSGATFTRMAHYDNAATNEEMANYCAWRVSGLFAMFDPLRLLSLQH